jgi:hypothetical protein
MFIMSEFAKFFNLRCSSAKSIENFLNGCTWLHGNNSKLIFLIDPDQESLVIIMENTSSLRPVSVKVACFKESISFFEKEMVIN